LRANSVPYKTPVVSREKEGEFTWGPPMNLKVAFITNQRKKGKEVHLNLYRKAAVGQNRWEVNKKGECG